MFLIVGTYQESGGVEYTVRPYFVYLRHSCKYWNLIRPNESFICSDDTLICSHDLIIRPNGFFICSNDLLVRPNESCICLNDELICSNDLLIRPNEEIFFIWPFYAPVLSY